MPREQRYVRELGDGAARVRVEIFSEGNTVTAFVVQMEAWYGQRWTPVRRYDDAHGRSHIDIYNRIGHRHKVWLVLASNEALTFAINEIRTNWEHYLVDFLER